MASATDAVVRLSHALGLPPTYPDILGLSVKILDVHGPGRDQDLLFASVGTRRWSRSLLRPARDYTQVTLSTVLPYDVAGRKAPIVAHVGPTANTAPYADIVRTGSNAVPLFNLYLGDIEGPRIGRVVTAERLPDQLSDRVRFDPWHTGPELRPVGRLNRLRRPTYAASQAGRGAPESALGEEARGTTTIAQIRATRRDRSPRREGSSAGRTRDGVGQPTHDGGT